MSDLIDCDIFCSDVPRHLMLGCNEAIRRMRLMICNNRFDGLGEEFKKQYPYMTIYHFCNCSPLDSIDSATVKTIDTMFDMGYITEKDIIVLWVALQNTPCVQLKDQWMAMVKHLITKLDTGLMRNAYFIDEYNNFNNVRTLLDTVSHIDVDVHSLLNGTGLSLDDFSAPFLKN